MRLGVRALGPERSFHQGPGVFVDFEPWAREANVIIRPDGS